MGPQGEYSRIFGNEKPRQRRPPRRPGTADAVVVRTSARARSPAPCSGMNSSRRIRSGSSSRPQAWCNECTPRTVPRRKRGKLDVGKGTPRAIPPPLGCFCFKYTATPAAPNPQFAGRGALMPFPARPGPCRFHFARSANLKSSTPLQFCDGYLSAVGIAIPQQTTRHAWPNRPSRCGRSVPPLKHHAKFERGFDLRFS